MKEPEIGRRSPQIQPSSRPKHTLLDLFHHIFAELQANPKLGEQAVDCRLLTWDAEGKAGLNLVVQ